MIDLLISTFCRIDDFCIVYEKELKIKSINYKNNKSGRKTGISLSEIITILIMFQAIRYKISKLIILSLYKLIGKNTFQKHHHIIDL